MSNNNEAYRDARKCMNKKIVDVIDTETNNWYDPLGFKLVFSDGSTLDVSADTGQGVGYVITELGE